MGHIGHRRLNSDFPRPNVARRPPTPAMINASARHSRGAAPIRIPSKQSANWLSFASGPFGYWAISVTQDRRIRLEAYLDSGDQERNKRLFDHARSSIAAPPGLEISWERLDAKRASRIACYYDDVPPFDDASRLDAREWTVSTFGSLYDTYNSELRTVATELRNNNPPAIAQDVLTAPQSPIRG